MRRASSWPSTSTRTIGWRIALPLQKHRRGDGNSVFLDDRGVPHRDQWSFLSTVKRIGRGQLEDVVLEAERRGRVLGVSLPPSEDDEVAPWTAPPSRRRPEPPVAGEISRSLELVLGNEIYVAKNGLAPALRNRLLRVAAFQNPEFYKAQAMRLSTYDKPRIITCAEEHSHHIGLPRGCLEEFDDPRLDTLFLTLPVSWRGTIAQYVGRLHRLYDGKRDVRVYDYADLNVPMLARMFDRRCRGYEAVGYTIVPPASAIPGWPADVVLPADALWKRDYAASVRRLVRDGVDFPLANLFVAAARPTPPAAEGANRARSASEAFLYRRLETLPETRGRLQLNTDLPIAFDGFGRMEVDLLCADSRVVVEVDGAQHLNDPVAYRRDRRKDQLLQENGYLVLRYLAEDLAKELDLVLDGILRSLSSRRAQTVPIHSLTVVRGRRP
jgi:very-short-patch-repair endonuclease